MGFRRSLLAVFALPLFVVFAAACQDDEPPQGIYQYQELEIAIGESTFITQHDDNVSYFASIAKGTVSFSGDTLTFDAEEINGGYFPMDPMSFGGDTSFISESDAQSLPYQANLFGPLGVEFFPELYQGMTAATSDGTGFHWSGTYALSSDALVLTTPDGREIEFGRVGAYDDSMFE